MYPYKKQYDHVVKYQKDGHIATITFDCPQNKNLLNEQLVDEYSAALDKADWDNEVRVIVLRGTGEVSFGYGDPVIIKSKLANTLRDGRQVMNQIANFVKKMYTMPKPIIGVAEGGCIGGGCNLVLSSDIVIASEKAYFYEVFVNYALSPDTGGLWALQRLVGPMKAKAIAMCGEPIPAQQALELGMVYKVAPVDKVYDEAYALAAKIASKSPVGISHTKQMSNRLHDYSMDTYFQIEADYICLGALSEDYKETNDAIGAERAPEYKGF